MTHLKTVCTCMDVACKRGIKVFSQGGLRTCDPVDSAGLTALKGPFVAFVLGECLCRNMFSIATHPRTADQHQGFRGRQLDVRDLASTVQAPLALPSDIQFSMSCLQARLWPKL